LFSPYSLKTTLLVQADFSSKWIKTKGNTYKSFYWQDGYGAFSVNPSEVDRVIAYIHNQHIHHTKKTFQDEYRAILHKYKVAYNDKYVWA